jgi:hypothetical protein
MTQITAHGGQVDVTEQHQNQLCAVIAEYRRVIEGYSDWGDSGGY